ncbi:MAG TPA: glycoside hydrolase family 97 N-terminal domain-containing protein, partial [Puia sp.]
MRKTKKVFVSFSLLCLFIVARAQQSETVSLGKIKMVFTLITGGIPSYAVYFNNKPVILPSSLGFKLNVDSSFDRSFQVIRTERRSFDQTWQTVWGETKDVRNHYEELTVCLESTVSENRLLNIIFRVFEDGVGFRYEFPLQPHLKYFIVTDE